MTPSNPLPSSSDHPDHPTIVALAERLDRLTVEGEVHLNVLRELYDQKITGLRELVELRIADLDRQMQRRFEENAKQVELALSNLEQQNELHAGAHAREHAAQEKVKAENQQQVEKVAQTTERAVDKAEAAMSKRLDAIEARVDEIRQNQGRLATNDALDKVDADLRQRLETEAKTRTDLLRPVLNWQQRSGGQNAVWIAVAGVAVTVILAVVIFLANWATMS